MLDSKTRRARLQQAFRREHVESTAFLNAIIVAGNRLRTARAFTGEPAFRFDTRWRLLSAIERCGGAPMFADAARLLRIRRQSVREVVLAAERAGEVEVFPCSDDRRAFQIAPTPLGRETLEKLRMPDATWTRTILSGLDPRLMESVTHVLHVVTQRLEGYERESRRAEARVGGATSAFWS